MLTVGDRKIKLKTRGRSGEKAGCLLIPLHVQEQSSWNHKISFVCLGKRAYSGSIILGCISTIAF